MAAALEANTGALVAAARDHARQAVHDRELLHAMVTASD
jgi:hypothetical protein